MENNIHRNGEFCGWTGNRGWLLGTQGEASANGLSEGSLKTFIAGVRRGHVRPMEGIGWIRAAGQ